MRVVLQRVTEASVTIDGQLFNEIQQGYLLLVGIVDGDDQEIDGKMNLSIEQIGGQVLSISQFTLYANCKKGRRPSFDQAARPEIASPLYDAFNDALRQTGLVVKPGIFGAEMKIRLLNDGPVTLILDSNELF